MADTSYDDGLENQGPDVLSYAATKGYEDDSPPHTVHDHHLHHQHGWTNDDLSNNNSQPDLSSSSSSSAIICTNNDLPPVPIVDNRSDPDWPPHAMDRGDYSDGAPSPISLDLSSQRVLNREGSADGGSLLPNPENSTSTINKSNSPTALGSGSPTLGKPAKSVSGSHKETNSSAESTPRRSTSAARAKSANPPSTGRDRMQESYDWSKDGGVLDTSMMKAGMLADPAKIAKEREREERVRQARERLEEERKRKLEELKEQQKLAQENRERQLEMRRRKIEDLRKRDTERRAAVEERRRMKEEIERLRKESILQKAEERVARFEAWRAGGRKVGNLGVEGSTPRHLSMSTSVLYRKSHSDLGSCTTLSHSNRHESTLGLDTIQEGRRSFVGRGANASPCASMTSSYHAAYSPAQPSPVRLRERSFPRKQRPASVATSMPSFVGGEPAKLSPPNRSKSSDRVARERSKSRPSRRKDKSASKEPTTDPARRDGDNEKDGGVATTTKKATRSSSFFDRLATPKFQRHQDEPIKDTPPKKESPIVRLSPRKAYSTTNLTSIKKKSSFRDKQTPREASSSLSTTPKHVTHRDSATSSPRNVRRTTSPAPSSMTKTASPRITPPPSSSGSPNHAPPPTAPHIQVTAPGASEDGTAAPRGVNQGITVEDYKAKMAERRRQAREKAEKEAEEESKRQEEERLAEEERLQEEEEEQRRLEEETIRLAEEAREAEEERLQRAIEAEDKRKREEAERLEQEKKAKEEADRKAKEEAERIEREKQERAKKEEEERLERKKKLEMIMKRVKTDPAPDSSVKMESPTKSSGSSPSRSALASPEVQELPPFAPDQQDSASKPESSEKCVESAETSDSSVSQGFEPSMTPVVRSASSGNILDSSAAEEKEMEKGDSLSALDTPARSTNGTESEQSPEVKSRFKSPLLQHLVENKVASDSPGTPKFKSPLLQNLLGKTKVGARMGLSASMGDLSLNKESSGSSSSMVAVGGGSSQKISSPSISPTSSSKEISKTGNDDEDKDVDESSLSAGLKSLRAPHLTNGSRAGEEEEEAQTAVAESSPKLSPLGMVDSALGTSIEPHHDDDTEDSVAMSNGHHLQGKMADDMMEDSSISLHYQEEEEEEKPVAASTQQSGQSSSQEDDTEEEEEEQQRGSGQFEEFIDLLDSGNKALTSTGPPIIAFEDNSRRVADIRESMS